MPLDLRSLVDTEKIDGGVWVPFHGTTFEVKVAHYGKPQMQKLYEACKTLRFDPATAQDKEDIDMDKFRTQFAERVIKDWRGLTYSILSTMIVMKEDPEVAPDYDIPCTPENKTFLLQYSVQFDRWLQSVCTSVETFVKAKKDKELKN